MKEHEERMAFRLPAAEAEQIRASASALGVSVSEWIRCAVAERLRAHGKWTRLTNAEIETYGRPKRYKPSRRRVINLDGGKDND